MWIALTLVCALTQALWMAMSKRRLQAMPSLRFMLFQRFPIAVLMLPLFCVCGLSDVGAKFWMASIAAATTECVRLVLFARGARRDYYATYSLLNMSPLFILILAPFVLGERVTPLVLGGAVCVVVGGFIFYHSGRFQLTGLLAAICSGILTVLSKLALTLSDPITFMIVLYATSTSILLLAESARSGPRVMVRMYRDEVGMTLPISAVNMISIVTFVYALDLATATQYGVLFRTNLVFGFILSLLLLREYKSWPWKVAGAACIVLGSVLIVLSKTS
ncbi:MAG: EamA family transporter [Planctomycetes bacterium]|nr:EamA family transporter [Planctomycetota bacterium]